MNMYCPACGQQQISAETRFCSRCGFLLTGIAEVMSHGGVVPGTDEAGNKTSPRKRGLMQGLFIFLLTFLLVPVVAMISIGLHLPPFGVAITAVLLTMGGLLRMAYALMFEPTSPGHKSFEENIFQASQARSLGHVTPGALPPQQSIPVESYVSPTAGAWRDTNDLVPNEPGTVTDSTTKLLHDRDTQ